jgi:hypothetical protein
MSSKKTPIELKVFELDDGDLLSIVEYEDKDRRAAIISEKLEDGVSKRRVIEFPLDPLLLSRLAQSLMHIADISQISIPKSKKHANVQFGKRFAGEVYRRTV